ncbi:cytoskeletal protein binding protein [Gonapodya sp. JEL0774]|nr:cytoskeletal protein binding protein [Gonapodya sp. JEL0774]
METKYIGCARSLYSFKPEGPEEIPLNPGDVVLLVDRGRSSADEWWKVKVVFRIAALAGNTEGVVPKAYLREFVSPISLAISMHPYAATSPEELTFPVGARFLVFHKPTTDKNWWVGAKDSGNGAIGPWGLLPLAYLKDQPFPAAPSRKPSLVSNPPNGPPARLASKDIVPERIESRVQAINGPRQSLLGGPPLRGASAYPSFGGPPLYNTPDGHLPLTEGPVVDVIGPPQTVVAPLTSAFKGSAPGGTPLSSPDQAIRRASDLYPTLAELNLSPSQAGTKPPDDNTAIATRRDSLTAGTGIVHPHGLIWPPANTAPSSTPTPNATPAVAAIPVAFLPSPVPLLDLTTSPVVPNPPAGQGRPASSPRLQAIDAQSRPPPSPLLQATNSANAHAVAASPGRAPASPKLGPAAPSPANSSPSPMVQENSQPAGTQGRINDDTSTPGLTPVTAFILPRLNRSSSEPPNALPGTATSPTEPHPQGNGLPTLTPLPPGSPQLSVTRRGGSPAIPIRNQTAPPVVSDAELVYDVVGPRGSSSNTAPGEDGLPIVRTGSGVTLTVTPDTPVVTTTTIPIGLPSIPNFTIPTSPGPPPNRTGYSRPGSHPATNALNVAALPTTPPPTPPTGAAGVRIWRDRTRAFSVPGSFMKVAPSVATNPLSPVSVHIRTPEGEQIAILLEQLCEEDKEFVRGLGIRGNGIGGVPVLPSTMLDRHVPTIPGAFPPSIALSEPPLARPPYPAPQPLVVPPSYLSSSTSSPTLSQLPKIPITPVRSASGSDLRPQSHQGSTSSNMSTQSAPAAPSVDPRTEAIDQVVRLGFARADVERAADGLQEVAPGVTWSEEGLTVRDLVEAVLVPTPAARSNGAASEPLSPPQLPPRGPSPTSVRGTTPEPQMQISFDDPIARVAVVMDWAPSRVRAVAEKISPGDPGALSTEALLEAVMAESANVASPSAAEAAAGPSRKSPGGAAPAESPDECVSFF